MSHSQLFGTPSKSRVFPYETPQPHSPKLLPNDGSPHLPRLAQINRVSPVPPSPLAGAVPAARARSLFGTEQKIGTSRSVSHPILSDAIVSVSGKTLLSISDSPRGSPRGSSNLGGSGEGRTGIRTPEPRGPYVDDDGYLHTGSGASPYQSRNPSPYGSTVSAFDLLSHGGTQRKASLLDGVGGRRSESKKPSHLIFGTPLLHSDSSDRVRQHQGSSSPIPPDPYDNADTPTRRHSTPNKSSLAQPPQDRPREISIGELPPELRDGLMSPTFSDERLDSVPPLLPLPDKFANPSSYKDHKTLQMKIEDFDKLAHKLAAVEREGWFSGEFDIDLLDELEKQRDEEGGEINEDDRRSESSISSQYPLATMDEGRRPSMRSIKSIKPSTLPSLDTGQDTAQRQPRHSVLARPTTDLPVKPARRRLWWLLCCC